MSKKRFEWEKKDDDMCSYVLQGDVRDECVCLQLAVWTHFDFQPAGHFSGGVDGEGYQLDPWTPTTQDLFKKYFKQAIEQAWGNGAVWLVHATKGLPDLWCDVKIIETPNRDDAHLCVLALKNPMRIHEPLEGYRTEYRNDCSPSSRMCSWSENPIDMRIAYERVVNATGDGLATRSVDRVAHDKKTYSFVQHTVLHEFGHYLRLGHPYATLFDESSDAAYGLGRGEWEMSDLMGFGDAFRSLRVGIPFRGRLDKHHYVSSNVEAWMALKHDANGGGNRYERPWPKSWVPTYNTPKTDPHWW